MQSSSSSDSDDESSGCRLKLIQAVRERSNPAVVESLLLDAAHSVDVAAIRDCPEKGNTLLHLALAKKCNKGAPFAAQELRAKTNFELLLEHGCRSVVDSANQRCSANSGGGDSPLTIAADDGLFSVCKLLLESGADVNFQVQNGVPDGDLFSPLLYAAKNASHNSGVRDQSALGRLLLQYGADVNARDAKGFTPLMWTAPETRNETGQIEFARVLLEFGAAVDATDNEGLTALWWACHFCQQQHRKVPSDRPPCSAYILLLLARGADTDLAPAAGAAGTVSTPRQMLIHCNLQRLLEPEVIVISDEEQVSEPPRTIRKCDPPLARQESQSRNSARNPPPVAADCSSSESDAEEMRELLQRKKSLLARRSMLRGELAEREDELASLKTKISENVASTFPTFPVIKNEQSSDSLSDSGSDRWGHSCAKCGQLGEMICCQHPGCCQAFHPQCVFLHAIPEGRWVCDHHNFSSKVAILPRDATSALKALLFKPAMTDVNTVWSRQRCFAENKIFIFDDADHQFLSEVQARVAADPFVQDIQIMKGLPSGYDAATQRRVEIALLSAFSNPNSLSSPSRVIVRTIPDSDPRVGLRGQSGLFAAQHIAKFTVLEAYRGRLRLRQRAAQSFSVMDKFFRGIFEYDIARESWLESRSAQARWWSELRHDLCIDPLQDAEGADGFGNEFMLMNDFRDKDPIQVLTLMTHCSSPHSLMRDAALRPSSTSPSEQKH